ncbi:Mak10 subunit, NatC N-terminal acetyltransferase-domain-containing protein [Ephemerocybe angulata]|uniref:Mak10 subunit, NatC N-terminal acetyltransferase-domain-containing protein n=1 Tax=Ephemerocybe angulata TaxID=980116 RepID=A0A8H6IFE3_9AGAR|nr:Mak10 subunit, NatC N-terminal acetyltransferase-domain-containing protein [Tulosesus angulatus]
MDSVLDMAMSSLPGDGIAFEDVTDLFAQASQDMNSETMYLMDGFTLMDAMSAFEIGEPRLDTGFVGEDGPPSFNPLAPLLPEEVCWILDRALGYEMEWQAGNMLAHTVFTLTYIYHLSDIETDSMLPAFLTESDPDRPIELITCVLGPCVQGLLKCVDLTWRDLQNNDLIEDTEDWQSDRCEVPVLEGVPVQFVIEKLNWAARFVATSPRVPDKWRKPLGARILLRKALLELLNTNLCRLHVKYQSLLDQARDCFLYLESQPPVEISKDSAAHSAFDPYISRRLNTSVPVRVIPLGPPSETWDRVRALIESLQEVKTLTLCQNPTTWEIAGKLRVWLKDAPRPAYVRSLAQTSFYNGLLILDQYSFTWTLDQLFAEVTGHTWTNLAAAIKATWKSPTAPPIPQLERHLYKLAISQVKSLWLNPPRLRRYMMRSVVDWHTVYDFSLDIANTIRDEGHIAAKLPRIIASFRLEAMREITLSGFQLELYAPPERPHAYWYTAKVIEAHIECYDDILPTLAKDSKPYEETLYRQRVLLALSALCTAVYLVTIPMIPLDWEEVQPAFERRYKWAFRPEYQRCRAAPLVQPDLYEFMRGIDDENLPPREHVQFAKSILTELVASGCAGGWVGQWAPERIRFLKGLLSVCENLAALPDSIEGLEFFDPKKELKWDPVNGHPWFPAVVEPPAEEGE